MLREADLQQAAALERCCFTSEAWSEKLYREEFSRSANHQMMQKPAEAERCSRRNPGVQEKEQALQTAFAQEQTAASVPPWLWLWCAVDADDDGRVLGTISLARTGEDGEIGNVAVLPVCRRQGIARALLEEALRFGRQEQEMTAFTLEVRAGNVGAIRLYESAGFREEGRRPRFYTEPVEDALILWCR